MSEIDNQLCLFHHSTIILITSTKIRDIHCLEHILTFDEGLCNFFFRKEFYQDKYNTIDHHL